MSDETIELRAKPKQVRRFNRKVLILIAGVAGTTLLAAAAFALRTPDNAARTEAKELYNTTTLSVPDGLHDLPKSYADVKPKLGPPLPGDLGAAFLGSETNVPPSNENPFQFQPANVEASRPAGQRYRSNEQPSARQQAQEQVRSSGLFFVENDQQANTRLGGPQANAGSAWPIQGPFDVALSQSSVSGAQTPHGGDVNFQGRKEAFLGKKVDADIYNPHRLQKPISPYQVMAGTLIPASLVTGLNSDLPGQVIAQVTEHVYDTPTGDHLLIPQGSRLIGEYDSVIAFGQSRALVAWHRLIMPDGSSVSIDNLSGVDKNGFSGLKDKVNYHTGRLFQSALLSTILSVGSKLDRDTDESEILEAIRDGGQRTINQAGQKIVTKQLNVQPTITVRPGSRLNIIVNKDLVLKPYGGR